MIQKNYGLLNFNFIDNIIIKKRNEMFKILKENIYNLKIKSMLDVGTTEDDSLKSSNFFIKKFNNIKTKKIISNQKIKKKKFKKILNKSITSSFSKNEIKIFKSDLVVSSATIEHVGNYKKQIKMIKNIILLTKKIFFITTPNRFFPIDFHTKIPLLHLLPKKLHRLLLNFFFLKEYAKEENLNLISQKEINFFLKKINSKEFDIKILNIKLLGLISNLIIFGKKKYK